MTKTSTLVTYVYTVSKYFWDLNFPRDGGICGWPVRVIFVVELLKLRQYLILALLASFPCNLEPNLDGEMCSHAYHTRNHLTRFDTRIPWYCIHTKFSNPYSDVFKN